MFIRASGRQAVQAATYASGALHLERIVVVVVAVVLRGVQRLWQQPGRANGGVHRAKGRGVRGEVGGGATGRWCVKECVYQSSKVQT